MNVVPYAIVAVLSFGAAWGIQGLRWSESDALERSEGDQAIAANVNAINRKLIESQDQTDSYRSAYLAYMEKSQNEISDLERRVTAGPERLYIKAKCPAVPAAGVDAAGAAGGSAELDPAAAHDYLAFERLYAKQFGLLQFCRSELKKRSQQKAP